MGIGAGDSELEQVKVRKVGTIEVRESELV
jgi:hypothetical protein